MPSVVNYSSTALCQSLCIRTKLLAFTSSVIRSQADKFICAIFVWLHLLLQLFSPSSASLHTRNQFIGDNLTG